MRTRSTWRQLSKFTGTIAIVLALVVPLALPGLALAAPNSQGGVLPIAYGGTVSGTITNAQYEVYYVFQGRAGDVVTITMTRTDTTLDPYLVLYNTYPGRTSLVEDDDSGGGLNAMIGNYALPADGSYYIVATRYGRATGTSTGSYTLTLAMGSAPGGNLPGTTSGGAFGGLPLGNSANQGGGAAGAGQDLAFTCDNISVPAAILLTFADVRPGFTYRVTVFGLDGFDPVIALEAEDGSGVCSDDEPAAAGSQIGVPGVGLVEANSLTSQILFTTGGAIGDIQMRIGGFGGVGGRYAAVFEGLAIYPNTEEDAVVISVSQSVQNDPLYVYMVSRTNALDPYMELAGTNIYCDDAGVGDCSDTPAFSGGGVSIVNGGTYIAGAFDAGIGVVPGGTGDRTFVFSSYRGLTAGDYAMIVIGTAPGAGGGTTPGSTSGVPLISYGDTVQNTIDNVNYVWGYGFNGQAGDTVTITMLAAPGSTLDPYLVLFDSNGNALTEDDDSAGGLNSRIVYTLPASGLYYIAATRFNAQNGSSSGAFSLSLSSSGTTGPVVSGPGGTGRLDYSLQPTFGSTSITSGFTPDPFTVQITSGGTVDVQAAVGSSCTGTARGYAASAPDYRLQYTSGQYILRFFFVGSADTTLVINAPNGQWFCDDDTGGNLQPMITFQQPLSGQYDIWVGSYSSGSFVPGTLYITETSLTPQSVGG